MLRQNGVEGENAAPFPRNLPALTSVRFVFALGVVLFHYQLQWPWDTMTTTGVLDRARLGVDAFFILSGFVLTHAYREALEARKLNYGRFVVARFARIYPAHLAVLALVLIMVLGASWMGADFNRDLYNPVGLLLTLLLVHAWLPDIVAAEWNGPSWSLSAEWFAYLAFPLFAWLGVKMARRPLVLLILSAGLFLALDQLYIVVFGDTVVHAELNLGVLRILPEFLYGIALYRLGERITLSPRHAVTAAWGAAAILLVLMHLKADDRLVVAAAGPLILSLALVSKAQADGPLGRPLMLLGGEASYALYLLHMPILIGWKGVVSALKGLDSKYILDWWEIGVLLVITLAAAVALHTVVERPARTWIRRQADGMWPAQGSKADMTAGSQPPDV